MNFTEPLQKIGVQDVSHNRALQDGDVIDLPHNYTVVLECYSVPARPPVSIEWITSNISDFHLKNQSDVTQDGFTISTRQLMISSVPFVIHVNITCKVAQTIGNVSLTTRLLTVAVRRGKFL